MKKFLKFLIIAIIVFAIIYLIYSAITAKIYFNIYTEMKNKVNSEDYFYGKMESMNNDPYNISNTFYTKNNIFVKIITQLDTTTNQSVTLKLWQDCSQPSSPAYLFADTTDSKEVQVFTPESIIAEPENKMYRYDVIKSLVLGTAFNTPFGIFYQPAEEYTYSKILLSILKHPTFLYSTEFNGEECLATRVVFPFSNPETGVDYATFTTYISKETNLPIGANYAGSEPEMFYYYFTQEVTDEDIAMPNLDEYTMQQLAEPSIDN